jgi:hypothetical protein
MDLVRKTQEQADFLKRNRMLLEMSMLSINDQSQDLTKDELNLFLNKMPKNLNKKSDTE